MHNIILCIIGVSSIFGIGFAIVWVLKNIKPTNPDMERVLRNYCKDYRAKNYDVRDNL